MCAARICTWLRMLAFRPMTEGEKLAPPIAAKPVVKPVIAPTPMATAMPVIKPVETPAVQQAPAVEMPLARMAVNHQSRRELKNHEQWLDVIEAAELKGPTRELAAHSVFVAFDNGVLKLALPDNLLHLRSDAVVSGLAQKLAPAMGEVPKISFEKANIHSETLHDRTERFRSEKQTDAQTAFMADPVVSQLLQQGAQIVPDSIRPLD